MFFSVEKNILEKFLSVSQTIANKCVEYVSKWSADGRGNSQYVPRIE